MFTPQFQRGQLYNERPHSAIHMSISSATLDCIKVAADLVTAGVLSSTTVQNISTVGGKKENGCVVTLHDTSRRQLRSVWQHIRDRHDLSCAHVLVDNTFSGCIYDFIRSTACPGQSPPSS